MEKRPHSRSKKTPSLNRLAADVARRLADCEASLVLAESCTCGLIASALGGVPGISRWLCGSAVVYQEATKSGWLHVPVKLIERYGVVSAEVAGAMAAGALSVTPRARLSASITGHLGPDAPKALDGVVYFAVAVRTKSGEPTIAWRRKRLPSGSGTPRTVRNRRRTAAACLVLQGLLEALDDAAA